MLRFFGGPEGIFETVWRLGTAAFVAVGLAILFRLWSTAGRETRLEGTADEVAFRTYDAARRILAEEVFPRAQITDLRLEPTAQSNGTGMRKLELVAGGPPVKLRHGVPGGEAESFINEVRAALGLPPLVDGEA